MSYNALNPGRWRRAFNSIGDKVFSACFLQAPVFLGAQLHSNGRACILVYRWVEMFELKHDCSSKTIMPKCQPDLEKMCILTTTHIKLKVSQQQSFDCKLCCLQPLVSTIRLCIINTYTGAFQIRPRCVGGGYIACTAHPQTNLPTKCLTTA
jgi:hypothetical protein